MGQHGQHRTLVIRLALSAGFTLLPLPAIACRLALILAIDVSNSVDPQEDQLQRQGLAQALRAPEVQDAFFVTSDPVALHIFEWSGRYNQTEITPWTMIESVDDLQNVASQVSASQRSYLDYPTALGHALGHAALLFQDKAECLFKTIDVSGDGQNNDGFPPFNAYDAFPFDDVTVNALVINGAGLDPNADLIPYFQQEVIRGPGAFVQEADGFEDYANAMQSKLIRELSSFAIGDLGDDGRTVFHIQ